MQSTLLAANMYLRQVRQCYPAQAQDLIQAANNSHAMMSQGRNVQSTFQLGAEPARHTQTVPYAHAYDDLNGESCYYSPMSLNDGSLLRYNEGQRDGISSFQPAGYPSIAERSSTSSNHSSLAPISTCDGWEGNIASGWGMPTGVILHTFGQVDQRVQWQPENHIPGRSLPPVTSPDVVRLEAARM